MIVFCRSMALRVSVRVGLPHFLRVELIEAERDWLWPFSRYSAGTFDFLE